jgi:hypothetical protein
MNIYNVELIFDFFGILNQDSNAVISSNLSFMSRIQNFRNDYLVQDSEIKHTIIKRQIYGECIALE